MFWKSVLTISSGSSRSFNILSRIVFLIDSGYNLNTGDRPICYWLRSVTRVAKLTESVSTRQVRGFWSGTWPFFEHHYVWSVELRPPVLLQRSLERFCRRLVAEKLLVPPQDPARLHFAEPETLALVREDQLLSPLSRMWKGPSLISHLWTSFLNYWIGGWSTDDHAFIDYVNPLIDQICRLLVWHGFNRSLSIFREKSNRWALPAKRIS